MIGIIHGGLSVWFIGKNWEGFIMKTDYRIMDLLNRYHLYLYSLGYKIQSIDDKHCSITDYVNAVEFISEQENMSVEELAENIELIFQQYDKNGEKQNLLPQDNNNRTLNGIKHFKEFVSFCTKI